MLSVITKLSLIASSIYTSSIIHKLFQLKYGEFVKTNVMFKQYHKKTTRLQFCCTVVKQSQLLYFTYRWTYFLLAHFYLHKN